MGKSKTKGISFSKDYEKEYEYVMKIKDASKYICELIKTDLKKKNKTTEYDSQEEETTLI